ncbi:MAG TPA: murein biosynthesis integral membrane protein MurJ [Xanthobacteraceae bacterium]|jgi:putative peptidoglycan lipid II flippase
MSLVRDVTTVGTATLLSRLLGFVRDAGIAAVLGAGVLSDAYFAALQIPNLFRRLLAEGALNSAFVPMWLRIREDRGMPGARSFGERVLGTMMVALGVIAAACVIFAPVVVQLLAPGFRPDGERFGFAVDFVRLSVPYIAIAGPVAVAASILNAEGRVGAAAWALVIFNGVFVAAVLLVIWLGGKASFLAGAALSLASVAAGLAQLLLVGGALMRQEVRPRRIVPGLSPEVRHFFAQAIPGVVAGGIPQLKLMAGAMVASSSQAAVSWLYYANRLYELPLGVVSIAIASVIVPVIAAGVRAGQADAIASAQSRAFEIALGLALPSAVAFAVLAEPIAGGLFERGAFGPHDTAMVAAALSAISAGLPGHVLEKVLGAVSFAHEDTRTPMVTALCGLTAAIVGSLLLFPGHGHVGIAAAIAISGWVGATTLAIVLWRRGWLGIDRAAQRRLPRIVLATAIMALAIMGGNHLIASVLDVTSTAVARIVTLVVLVTAGLAVYLAAIQMLGIASLDELRAAMRERL